MCKSATPCVIYTLISGCFTQKAYVKVVNWCYTNLFEQSISDAAITESCWLSVAEEVEEVGRKTGRLPKQDRTLKVSNHFRTDYSQQPNWRSGDAPFQNELMCSDGRQGGDLRGLFENCI